MTHHKQVFSWAVRCIKMEWISGLTSCHFTLVQANFIAIARHKRLKILHIVHHILKYPNAIQKYGLSQWIAFSTFHFIDPLLVLFFKIYKHHKKIIFTKREKFPNFKPQTDVEVPYHCCKTTAPILWFHQEFSLTHETLTPLYTAVQHTWSYRILHILMHTFMKLWK